MLPAAVAMQHTGLAALAATYGLERAELHQLQLWGQRFFDHLAEALGRHLGAPLEIAELAQRSLAFAGFCAAAPLQHLVVAGFEGEPALAFRLEHALALALIDLLLGGSGTLPASATQPPLSATERRIVADIIEKALGSAFETVSAALFGHPRRLEILHHLDHVGVLSRTLEPAQAVVALEARCGLGEQHGWLGIALPIAMLSQIRRRLAPPHPPAPLAARPGLRLAALADAPLTLRAVIGTHTLSLGELSRLGIGSVLTLGKLQDGLPQVHLAVADHILRRGTVVEARGWRRFWVQSLNANELDNDDKEVDCDGYPQQHEQLIH